MSRNPTAAARRPRKARVLIVTPEITYLPEGMGNMANYLRAKAGGLADVSAALVAALFEKHADVHVALPHFRRMFHVDVGQFIGEELRIYKKKLHASHVHLAEDRAFYYRDSVYSDSDREIKRVALAFQREVLNHTIPEVNPDLIHCNDWMTGLIPAAARRLGIPCLVTVHNIHTKELTLREIEESGIDPAEFWRYLFFQRPPGSYEESRSGNPVDLLGSALFASHFVNTVSPTFLEEVCNGWHPFIPGAIRRELRNKRDAGCAIGILNAPDLSFNPAEDKLIAARYTAADHAGGKRANKLAFQKRLGLAQDAAAPLFFWPSRLDPIQKGCQLLTHILHEVVRDYAGDGLQVAVVANGPFQKHFHEIVRLHGLYERVAVRDFDEELSHLGYAASDYLLMPSFFEPCGLPQMIGAVYGSLPVAHDTGGLHDTVRHLDMAAGTGNGFVFRVPDPAGLRWAMDQAMTFHRLPPAERGPHVARVMLESATAFTHERVAEQYLELYERMLQRPLIPPF